MSRHVAPQIPGLFSRPKYWAAEFGIAPELPMTRAEMDRLGWEACDVILVTGDGDFTPLVERLRYRGTRVEVASVPGSVARSLQAMANGFVDLTQISEPVHNLQLPRPEPEIAQPEPDFDLEEAPLPA